MIGFRNGLFDVMVPWLLFIVVLIINVPVEFFQLGHQSEKLDLGGKTFYKNISHLGIEILTVYVLLLRKGLKKK